MTTSMLSTLSDSAARLAYDPTAPYGAKTRADASILRAVTNSMIAVDAVRDAPRLQMNDALLRLATGDTLTAILTAIELETHNVRQALREGNGPASIITMLDPAIALFAFMQPGADAAAMRDVYRTVMRHLGAGRFTPSVDWRTGRNADDTRAMLYATFDTHGMEISEQMRREEEADAEISGDERLYATAEYMTWVAV